MREAHPLEQAVGIDYYVSDADGIGGTLRVAPEDFRVRELELDSLNIRPADAHTGDFPNLVLRVTLRGWDTNDFAGRLSDELGVSRERVSWAGTKDKHAVTTQLFTVHGGEAESVPEVPNADIEVVGRLGRTLDFGDLAGNGFRIRVRDPERPENAAAITEALRDFGGRDDMVGVPNFFGHQRFGSIRPVTHTIGLHVLRGEWREAVLAYCGGPTEDEPEETQKGRAIVDEEAESDDPDWHRALDAIPGYLGYERGMLHRLAEDGAETEADWRNALESVPSNLQRLFVNAAQSYAFNRILSERLARGLPFDEPVEGDVVCFADRDAPDGLELPDVSRLQSATGRRVDVMARHIERGRAFVTAPLVGTETVLADGEQGEIEREVLDELDLEPSDFDLPGNFRSTGTRRAILVRTDLTIDDDDEFAVDFALPHGSYATAVMREYLKAGPLDL
ncbi:tRNA pseudouridine(13) synthase TruD [Haloferax sp. MBLA0076]|uniref:Probable tRNA pseudouridine synthase D n=1 Tax=Haloferax litoreum TaxID=2666140 RepID=A0A6A8GBW2_9EURY|nr:MULTISPECIES: tRNA pseudouridine(13) synthase TruD [Haloferax]KAB1192286.1 tRNA pseudouridine(13) synthase TruD [Haloferax sp. CBA1148]MRX20744.1 tRNA pseudouridine(13) synthase TruD [Haloferax litoreum]